MSDIGNSPTGYFWSSLYAQLSEFFKEPSAGLVEDVASGRMARFFEEQLRILGLDPAPCSGLAMDGDVGTKLRDEYQRLFRGPLPPYVVPVESVYKIWTSDPGCHLSLAGEKGSLMGDSAVDMNRRYREGGIVIPDEYSSMPDHIALELEYMSFLSRRGDQDACWEFLARHLDWLTDLTAEINAAGGGEFYASGARIARDIVDWAQNCPPTLSCK
jgi:putative dimethyl sulfoxide reductase chaperone